jgi:hypothetical protein
MRRGQSLIVWAISEGREAAKTSRYFLMGKSNYHQRCFWRFSSDVKLQVLYKQEISLFARTYKNIL